MVQHMTITANVWQSCGDRTQGYDKYANLFTVYQSHAALGNLQALHIYRTNLSCRNITSFCTRNMLLVYGQVYISCTNI